MIILLSTYRGKDIQQVQKGEFFEFSVWEGHQLLSAILTTRSTTQSN